MLEISPKEEILLWRLTDEANEYSEVAKATAQMTSFESIASSRITSIPSGANCSLSVPNTRMNAQSQ